LNVAKSSLVKYPSAVLDAAHSLVFIVDCVSSHVLLPDRVVIQSFVFIELAVSSPVLLQLNVVIHSLVFIVLAVSSQLLVQLVLLSFVLSALVKNRFVVHSVISSLSPLASLRFPLVAIADKSHGCTAVAHFQAPVLIVSKSDIVACLPLNQSSTYFLVAGW
jgi:hypothetical protein